MTDRAQPMTPGVRTICFDPNPADTRGEAEFIGRLAKQYRWHSVVLVTTRGQDTRARIIVGRCFGGSGLRGHRHHYPWVSGRTRSPTGGDRW